MLTNNLLPRPQEIAVRAWILEKLEFLVRKVLKWTEEDASISVFGSQKTMLYLPQGDVDIHRSFDIPSVLTQVHAALLSLARNAPWNVCDKDTLDLLLHIRIPILKFKSRIGGLKVDVIANTTSGNLSSQTVIHWVTEYSPYLKPMVLLLKSWLNQREYDEVFTGGLGGYSVVNMMVSVMQRNEWRSAETPMAKLLFWFLETYGLTFPYKTKGISVKRGCLVDKPKEVYRIGYAASNDAGLRLFIEDPSDPTNNVSKGTFRMESIRESLLDSYVRLQSLIEGSLPIRNEIISEIITIDPGIEKWRDKLCEDWDAFIERNNRRISGICPSSSDLERSGVETNGHGHVGNTDVGDIVPVIGDGHEDSHSVEDPNTSVQSERRHKKRKKDRESDDESISADGNHEESHNSSSRSERKHKKRRKDRNSKRHHKKHKSRDRST
ncbi:hypothetical protein HK098_001335 [Nowakowskiella sp. JEL0407]|nr:hypothetical protein HK098_001335 [Nowakowskiella sp. JEL0407]